MQFLAIDMKKECKKCKESKPLSSFHKHKGRKDVHTGDCKSCAIKRAALWQDENPERRREVKDKYRRETLGQKTREQWKKDLQENAIGKEASNEKYRRKQGMQTREQYDKERKENAIGRKVSLNKYTAKRRTRTQKPLSELDTLVINEAYKLAEEREKITGFKWHVDHIVPLHHKDACGLHTAANIQVVPASWNLKKGNRNMEEYRHV